MAYTEMTELDFQTYGLVSQKDAYLNEENGRFSNPKWRFEAEQITTDEAQIRRKYTDGTNIVYLISNKVTVADGDEWSSYKFYKEV